MLVRKVKQRLQPEKGAAALYFALVLFLLLGMGSIALDGSNLYAQHRRMQTAADAATLAGANILALGGDTAAIDAEVKSLAMANGVGDVPWTIGSDGKSKGVIFHTAAPFDTPALMAELIEWTKTQINRKELHPLLIVATFVVVFLHIHPFQDGNGRLSRALTTLLLLQLGYSYVPYSSFERVIEENKDSYYLALRRGQAELDEINAKTKSKTKLKWK